MLNLHKKILRLKIFIARTIFNFLNIFLKKEIITFKRKHHIWTLRINDIVGLSVFLTGGFQTRRFYNFLKIQSDSQVFIDIGANIGSHTINAFKVLKNLHVVYSIEPDEQNFKLLSKNITDNELSKSVMLFNSYVGERIDTNSISQYPLVTNKVFSNDFNGISGSFNSANRFNIELLGNIKKNQNCVVKIDVDGNELQVVNALNDFLTDIKPNILIEFNKDLLNVEDLKDTLNFLEKIGYMVYKKNSQLKPLDVILKSKKNLGDDYVLINKN